MMLRDFTQSDNREPVLRPTDKKIEAALVLHTQAHAQTDTRTHAHTHTQRERERERERQTDTQAQSQRGTPVIDWRKH